MFVLVVMQSIRLCINLYAYSTIDGFYQLYVDILSMDNGWDKSTGKYGKCGIKCDGSKFLEPPFCWHWNVGLYLNLYFVFYYYMIDLLSLLIIMYVVIPPT